MSAVVDFGPGELCEALANINLAKVEWRRKVQLLHVIGRYPEGHRISYEALAARTHIAERVVGRLVREMVDARILVLLEPKAGPVAAAYAVNPRVEQWSGVPWTSTIAEVWSFVFHAEQWGSQEVALPHLRGPRKQDKRNLSRTSGPRRRDNDQMTRSGGPERWDNEKSDRHQGRKYAGQRADLLQQQFPTSDGSTSPASAGEGGAVEVTPDPPGWKTVTRSVLTVAAVVNGRRFLSAANLSVLREVVEEVGADQVLALLDLAAVEAQGMGVPQLVDWLRAYADADVSVLLAMAERAAAAPVELPAPEPVPFDPPRPVLRPVADVLAADEPPAEAASVRAALRQARGLLDPLGDHPTGRLNPTEVTQ